MESNPLLQQLALFKQKLLDEGILDENFGQLESFVSDEAPNFVEDTINLYYEEAKETIANVEDKMTKHYIDFKELDMGLNKLKGSCATVGAKKVKVEVDATREFCNRLNPDGIKTAIKRVKTEHENFKAKLDAYLEMLKQAKDPKG